MNQFNPLEQFTIKERNELLSCFKPSERVFEKNEIIMHSNESSNFICLLKSGNAQLTSDTFDGDKIIIDYFESGDFFGSTISNLSDSSYYIMAKSKCVVLFIDYNRAMRCCENNCSKHLLLIDKIIFSVSHRTQIHIDILSRRSIRKKLLTYFKYISIRLNRQKFKLPLSLSDLAVYIAADRSSMMRELKKLNDEGIVITKGSSVEILMELHI